MASIISAGTTSNTALNLSADTTGILQFQTNGTTAAMTIDTSQNVGIGTASPTTKLHIVGRLNVVGSIGTISTDSQGLTLDLNRNGTTGITNNNTGGSQALTFGTGGSEYMRIDSSGNVGIGTSSPQIRLQSVASGSGLQEVFRVGNTQSRGAGVGVKIGFQPNNDFVSNGLIGAAVSAVNTSGSAGNDISLVFSTGSGGAESERMRIDSSGNVGIGTSSPGVKLDISGGSIRTIVSGGTPLIYFNNGTTQHSIGNSSGAMPFNIDGTERMRITSGGTVVVGTTAQVGSEILGALQTANNQCFAIQANNASYTNDAQIIYANRNTTNNSFYYFACYNIGATAYKFRIADSGNATNTNGSYGTISDAKLKENIVDATPKLDKVNQLKVRNYNFIGDDLKQIGFVAQEFEQVFPSMVEESADKDVDGNDLGTTTKTIKTTVLIPILVKAIQEQQAMIETLQAEVAALKGVN